MSGFRFQLRPSVTSSISDLRRWEADAFSIASIFLGYAHCRTEADYAKLNDLLAAINVRKAISFCRPLENPTEHQMRSPVQTEHRDRLFLLVFDDQSHDPPKLSSDLTFAVTGDPADSHVRVVDLVLCLVRGWNDFRGSGNRHSKCSSVSCKATVPASTSDDATNTLIFEPPTG